jgi:class 3 adenylate cyclase/PAS domain-containing protein
MIDEYLSFVVPALESLSLRLRDRYNEHTKQLLNVILFTAVAYTVLLLLFVLFSFMNLHKVWQPAFNTLEALRRVSYSAIPKVAQEILNESRFTIAFRSFDFSHEYYDQIFCAMNDAVLVVGRSSKIIAKNLRAAQLFFKNNAGEGVIDLSEIPDSFRVKDSEVTLSERITIVSGHLTDNEADRDWFEIHSRPQSKTEEYYSCTISPLFDESSSSVLRSIIPSCYAVVLRDITDEEHKRQMAAKEKLKFESTMKAVMPEKVFEQLLQENRGKKSLAFVFEEAAICFCDIVQFTPWCARKSPKVVVDTLQKMFQEFDDVLHKHPSMTKIKTIGDCYMAASGILEKTHEPWKGIVEFCLDLIEAIGRINIGCGESLAVRIGAAYGKKIAAGVLSIEKPMFDVWGKLVKEAQDMESNGRPMMLHINRELFLRVKDLDLEVSFTEHTDATVFVSRNQAGPT